MIFTGTNKQPTKIVSKPRFLGKGTGTGKGTMFDNATPGTKCGSCGK